ncbi:leucyl aminopeptidase [Aureimonas flava]|uniref:Probable cytosol aminopeptidase n=1 Tax=Aureimonas flava TaxID=2320271 RepID=A0A3A1WR69_9HYPH|nr:leucyl aminopeptidase [Aureimonas flava]RIY03536.1 leucyl aminopeptidase [Aureimonas flava]
MSDQPIIAFAPLQMPETGTLVILAGQEGALPPGVPDAMSEVLKKAIAVAKFKGKELTSVEAIAPSGSSLDRIVVVGTAGEKPFGEEEWLRLGGTIAAGAKGTGPVTVWGDGAATPAAPCDLATIGLGILLRSYKFDRYKSKKSTPGEEPESETARAFTIAAAAPDEARSAFAAARALADGVILARDLVNEPANVLTTTEYASRIEAMSSDGLEIEILDETRMAELGMRALLGVAQGSPMPPRLCIMRWNGGAEGEAPVAFVGKGVIFDTGGVSIKPAAGMDEMKGDMGGSAAVVGLMRALAGRKAKVNAIGVVGLVENAVDGNAQRPGDIVTAMSGTTIEVLNTDAEGRLVLADALWYTQDCFKPKFMVNLATLTGAIIVALGNHHAGLFSNDDELANRLLAAGLETGEKVWRMPLGKEYDKLIEGKFADIKNVGAGRAAGATTAAQFLQRFVNDVPWAHLDVAGTAMGSPANEYNQSWASGFGVRLLNKLVEEHYEAR